MDSYNNYQLLLIRQCVGSILASRNLADFMPVNQLTLDLISAKLSTLAAFSTLGTPRIRLHVVSAQPAIASWFSPTKPSGFVVLGTRRSDSCGASVAGHVSARFRRRYIACSAGGARHVSTVDQQQACRVFSASISAKCPIAATLDFRQC